MKYSGNDTLTRIVAEAMPALMPAAAMKRWKRVDYAIDESGNINYNAVQLLGNLSIVKILDDTQYSTASTTVYTTCVETTFTLPDGTWTLVIEAKSRGQLSAATNMDYRLSVDGESYGAISRSAPSTAAAPFHTTVTLTGIAGGRSVAILAEFKPASAATATVNDSMLSVIAMRTA